MPQPAPIHRSLGLRGNRLAPLCLLAMGAATILPALPAGAATIEFPRPGFACDPGQRVCFDQNGASLNQTGRTYGAKAERDLLRRISGRPPAREIQFSNGVLCDLRQRQCWDDGWRRRNVSSRLSRHLFGGSGPWNPAASGQRNCDLAQRGRRIFNGGCRLFSQGDAWGRTYVVETRDGRRYNFVNRNGQFLLRDATGLWPVTLYDRGNSVVFRWSDLQLETSRGWGWNRGFAPAAPTPTGQALGELIDSLFR